jgi:hypothetical protein
VIFARAEGNGDGTGNKNPAIFGSSGIDVGHSTHSQARKPLAVKDDPGTRGQ